MEHDYWLTRWQQGETGFHQDEINVYLRQYWQKLDLAQGSEVFVPLCGKSRDMLWLRSRQHTVLGVELSTIAVQTFFRENGHFTQHKCGEKFERYEMDGIKILCGDFFDLGKNELANVNAVYDRAALVALPLEMRKRYVRHLLNHLPPATKILLINFDYPQSEMPGPPFAVSPVEVEALFHEYAEIKLLDKLDVLAQNQRFQDRGLSRLHESIFLLTLR
jgi:thiopurine S-methyltransferase